ncbi:MAG: response regulator [Phycisphaeraceae bacterium]|nr:response regulator [Phycisphaeraceae bacterium]
MQARENPIETIHLNPRERQRLLNKNTQQPLKSGQAERRGLRVIYQPNELLISLLQPAGQRVTFRVMPRNLSAKGVGFVHGRYVHVGSECLVTLVNLAGMPTNIGGVVVQCRHEEGMLHQVSVKFHNLIDLEEFVKLSDEDTKKLRSELQQVELAECSEQFEQLKVFGKALVIDDGSADRRLLRMWLSQMGLEVVEALNALEAMAAAKEGVDLVLLDVSSDQGKGMGIATQIRGQRIASPIIGLSADESEEIKQNAMKAGCDAFLVKPFQPDELTNAIRQVIKGANRDNKQTIGPLRSSLAADPLMKPLIQAFVAGLEEQVGKLRRALEDADVPMLATLCHQLKGAGASHGFEEITQVAKAAMEDIKGTEKGVQGARARVDELVLLLQRVVAD